MAPNSSSNLANNEPRPDDSHSRHPLGYLSNRLVDRVTGGIVGLTLGLAAVYLVSTPIGPSSPQTAAPLHAGTSHLGRETTASTETQPELEALKTEIDSQTNAAEARFRTLEGQLHRLAQATKSLPSAADIEHSPNVSPPVTLDQVKALIGEEVRSTVREEMGAIQSQGANGQPGEPTSGSAETPVEPENDLVSFSIEEDGQCSDMTYCDDDMAAQSSQASPTQEASVWTDGTGQQVHLRDWSSTESERTEWVTKPVQYSYWASPSVPGPGTTGTSSVPGPNAMVRPGPSGVASSLGGTPTPQYGAASPEAKPSPSRAERESDSVPATLTIPGTLHVIPRFSIARARLLIGAVAPASGSGSQPMPVLGLITGPFMTPGNAHLDFKGDCNFGGLAVGNDATNRVLVTVTRLTCVAPDGTIWEAPKPNSTASGGSPAAIGYMAGRMDQSGKTNDSYIGIDAKKVSSEGSMLLARFAVQTVGDYAKALAQAQVTTSSTPGALGGATSTQNVTGDKDSYIIGNSLASRAFPDLSSFITQLLSEAKPYFYVEGGREAYVVLTEPVDITDVLDQYLPDGFAVHDNSNAPSQRP